MEATETAAPVEPRVFYSKAGGLMVTVKQPEMMIVNGVAQVVGGKIVEFIPQGDKWGRYVTTDPEVIAALEKNPNVVGPDVYQDLTTSAEIKLKMERDQTQRLITQNNELLRQLDELRGKAAKPVSSK
jgi:hypothetical protein